MKINFKKVGSILASLAMVGATAGMALAANYPAPFAVGGSSDVAIVTGAAAASSDYTAATSIGSDLSAALASQIGGGTAV